jgi:hypothetical protein
LTIAPSRLQEALDLLHAEVQRRQQRIAPQPARRKRSKRQRGKRTRDAETAQDVDREMEKPRILREQSSAEYTDPNDVHREVDLIMAWLQREDVSSDERSILLMELENLAPSLQEDRARQATERRERKVQQALTPQVSGDARNQLIETVKLIEAIRPHPDDPAYSYLMFGDEMIILHAAEADAIRQRIGGMMDVAAGEIKSVKDEAFNTWSFQAEVDREHLFASWAVSLFTGTDAGDIYDRMSPHMARAERHLSRYRAARRDGKLVAMAEAISSAEEGATKANLIAKQWVGDVISTGENIVTGLKITRDLSFAISTSYFGGAGFLALKGSMGAARAGLAVSGLGTAGTGVARGGSNLAGQALTGEVDFSEFGRETIAGGKQGLVNTTAGVVTVGTAGLLRQGTSFTGRALRTGIAGSAGGATAGGLEATVEGKSAGEIFKSAGVGGLSGFAGGAFGGGNLPRQVGLRGAAVGSVLDATGGAASAYIAGGSREDIQRAAAISVLTGRATVGASRSSRSPPRQTDRPQQRSQADSPAEVPPQSTSVAEARAQPTLSKGRKGGAGFPREPKGPPARRRTRGPATTTKRGYRSLRAAEPKVEYRRGRRGDSRPPATERPTEIRQAERAQRAESESSAPPKGRERGAGRAERELAPGVRVRRRAGRPTSGQPEPSPRPARSESKGPRGSGRPRPPPRRPPAGPPARRQLKGSATTTGTGYRSFKPADPVVERVPLRRTPQRRRAPERPAVNERLAEDMRTAHTLRETTEAQKSGLTRVTQRGEPGQTFSVTEQQIAPGAVRRTTTSARAEQPGVRRPRRVGPRQIERHLDDMRQNGVDFQFDNPRHINHAEVKQSVARPNEPIYVDRPMCGSCQRFKTADAMHRQRPQMVTDPDATRVFYPDGTVVEYWHGGDVWRRTQRVEHNPDGLRMTVERYEQLN